MAGLPEDPDAMASLAAVTTLPNASRQIDLTQPASERA
jgi:hypothetical protein